MCEDVRGGSLQLCANFTLIKSCTRMWVQRKIPGLMVLLERAGFISFIFKGFIFEAGERSGFKLDGRWGKRI